MNTGEYAVVQPPLGNQTPVSLSLVLTCVTFAFGLGIGYLEVQNLKDRMKSCETYQLKKDDVDATQNLADQRTKSAIERIEEKLNEIRDLVRSPRRTTRRDDP